MNDVRQTIIASDCCRCGFMTCDYMVNVLMNFRALPCPDENTTYRVWLMLRKETRGIHLHKGLCDGHHTDWPWGLI